MKLSYQGWSNISSYSYPSGNFQTLVSNWRWLWPLKSILLETNLHLLEHQKVLRVFFEKVGQIRPPYLLTYMGVFDLGQTRAACSDGFSDHCIFVSPLLLLLKGKVFTLSFFQYVPSPWSRSPKRTGNQSMNKDVLRSIVLFFVNVDFM